MNKNFERNYIRSVDSSVPDMEKLWKKISSSTSDNDITSFVSASEECRKTNSLHNIGTRRVLAAAAVFTAVVCTVSVISEKGISTGESEMLQNDTVAENYDHYGAYDSASYVTASMGWDYSTDFDDSENKSYFSLNLAETETGIYAAMSQNTDNEEYFVEDKVLSETDFFIDGMVISEEPYEDGGIKYTVSVIHAVSDDSRVFSETEEIISDSPYALRIGREYLLPISEINGSYTVAFENAPQIEFTLDRQLVCHNGWKTLNEKSVYLEYPQTYPDDFFYDRMNLAAESSLEELFDKWERIRA